jgi:ankyrin repeat protein
VITKNKDIDAINNEAIVALLLQYGANMFLEDNLCQSPLKLATDNNHICIQRLFLKEIKEKLRTAVLKNDIITTNFLLSAKTNPNQEDDTTGCTLLHFAARYGFLEITNLLLQHGADVNKTNKIGFTALHYAADNQHVAITQLLLNYGSSKAIKDKQGKTPEHWIRDKDSKIGSVNLPNLPQFLNRGIFI